MVIRGVSVQMARVFFENKTHFGGSLWIELLGFLGKVASILTLRIVVLIINHLKIIIILQPFEASVENIRGLGNSSRPFGRNVVRNLSYMALVLWHWYHSIRAQSTKNIQGVCVIFVQQFSKFSKQACILG